MTQLHTWPVWQKSYAEVAKDIKIAKPISEHERARLIQRIKQLLVQQNTVLVAHYYTHPDLQILADDSGGCVADSLEMARFGHAHKASTLVVAGVRFMGETAKILNPEKRVLVVDADADCSLDLGCPEAQFAEFCDAHPRRKVVVYANTSAAVKARADWVVTSSIAVDIVRYLHNQGEKIIWAPDRHLGDYVQRKTGADMLMWQGSCIVHDTFKANALQQMRSDLPDAAVLVHPESPAAVIAQADVVGSTTGLIDACKRMPNKIFIVATDTGIFHKMKLAAPDKQFLPAPTGGGGATCESCNFCPWMALNDLRKLADVLTSGSNEVDIPERIRRHAYIPLKRLLDFSTAKNNLLVGNA